MSRAPEPSLDGSNFSICAARASTRALRILTDQDTNERIAGCGNNTKDSSKV